MTDTQAKHPRWWPGFRRDHPLARGCVGYWSLWEGQAEKAYDVANPFDTGHHGTLTNMDGSDWGSSSRGTVLTFTDDTDYVSIADNFSPSQITVAELFYPTDLTTPAYPNGANNGWAAGITHAWDYSAGGAYANEGRWIVVVDAVRKDVISTSIFAEMNAWNMAVMTYDGSIIRSYINGLASLTPEAVTGPITWPGVPFRIGDTGSTGESAAGDYSLTAIWDYAFTPSQVAEFTYDPYALIRPPSTITTFAMGGGAGNNVPQKYMHYARMRAG